MTPVDILVSYVGIRDDAKMVALCNEHRKSIALLIDSGAFSAFHSGVTITLDEYSKWLTRCPVKPCGYFTLDVVGDPVATAKNDAELVRRGHKPIPIITRGTPDAQWDDVCRDAKWVAIGGVKQGSRHRFIAHAMRLLNGRRCHILGVSDTPTIHAFKPYSCDATSWNSTMRYGIMVLYDPRRYRLLSVRKRDFQRDAMRTHWMTEACRLVGYEVGEIVSDRRMKGVNDTMQARLTIRSYLYAQRVYRDKLGVRMFIATTYRWQLEMVMREFQAMVEKGVLK